MESKYKAQINYAKRKGFVKIGYDADKETRDRFRKACQANNTNTTAVLKDFVTNYIKKNEKK